MLKWNLTEIYYFTQACASVVDLQCTSSPPHHMSPFPLHRSVRGALSSSLLFSGGLVLYSSVLRRTRAIQAAWKKKEMLAVRNSTQPSWIQPCGAARWRKCHNLALVSQRASSVFWKGKMVLGRKGKGCWDKAGRWRRKSVSWARASFNCTALYLICRVCTFCTCTGCSLWKPGNIFFNELVTCRNLRLRVCFKRNWARLAAVPCFVQWLMKLLCTDWRFVIGDEALENFSIFCPEVKNDNEILCGLYFCYCGLLQAKCFREVNRLLGNGIVNGALLVLTNSV